MIAVLMLQMGTAVAEAGAAPAPAESGAPAGSFIKSLEDNVLLRVLLALAAVILGGNLIGRVVERLGQPRVIGEILAGLLLGPSLFGERFANAVLPAAAVPPMQLIAQLGVVLYMFIVGLELHGQDAKKELKAILGISIAGMAVPFALGSALAPFLYKSLAPPEVSITNFILFFGVAMSVTAFPVLARILRDQGMFHSTLGVTAIRSAAVSDAAAWSLLAVVVGIARAEPNAGLSVVAKAMVYLAFMYFVARPLLRKLISTWASRELPRSATAWLLLLLFLSAATAEAIGIHAIFGAFLLGVIIHNDAPVAKAFTRQFEPVATTLFLPAFFALTGMRTRIDLLNGVENWLICILIIAIASAGKILGTFVAARLAGFGSGFAFALGALMNTRGLMELVVLNIGLDLGIISQRLFAMMVIMALATTWMTGPFLRVAKVG